MISLEIAALVDMCDRCNDLDAQIELLKQRSKNVDPVLTAIYQVRRAGVQCQKQAAIETGARHRSVTNANRSVAGLLTFAGSLSLAFDHDFLSAV
jgi:hypothetical protein